MAGFNFETLTIVNDASIIDVKNNVLSIKDKGINLKKDNIKIIRKQEGTEPTMAKMVVDFASINFGDADYGRIEVYINVDGAEPAMFSNAFAQKGHPFWVEFQVGEDASATAATVAELFAQHDIFVLDKNVIKVTVTGTKVTFESTKEYLRFGNVAIYKFDAIGNESKVAYYKSPLAAKAPFTLTVGKNGFGTYKQLIKDLRLPTAANLGWAAPKAYAMPVFNALYNQYIVEYEDEAVNDGLQAVGQRMVSYTKHVIWVKNDLATVIAAIDGLTAEATEE